MALSGSTNRNQTAAQLIRQSLLKLGVINPVSPIQDATMNIALDALNNMIKHWQGQGAHMWTEHEGCIVLEADTASYTFPDTSLAGGDVGVVNVDALKHVTVTTDAITAATTLVIDSTTGMTATDKIIVSLDDDTRHETTIASITNSTTLELSVGLPSAASEGRAVYSYPVAVTQVNLFAPQQINNVRLVSIADINVNMSLSRWVRSEYYSRNINTLNGRSVAYYFEDSLTNKKLMVYPTPTGSQDRLEFTYVKSLDDVDAFTNNLEFPVLWHRAIVYNLAVELAFEFGKEAKIQALMPFASTYLQEALGFDDDHTSIQIVPGSGN